MRRIFLPARASAAARAKRLAALEKVTLTLTTTPLRLRSLDLPHRIPSLPPHSALRQVEKALGRLAAEGRGESSKAAELKRQAERLADKFDGEATRCSLVAP